MKHIAFDLGAESGRAIVGWLCDGKLETREIHRFATQGTMVNGSLRWDVYRLFSELKKGLVEYAKFFGDEPCTMGVDTWGVDYGILDKNGKLISIPYHYRDERNIGTTEIIEKKLGVERLYELTGIEYMEINTINQLVAANEMDDPAIKCGEKLLFMADLLQYFLCGVAKAEFCLSTTSSMYNTVESKWEDKVFDALDIPKKIQPEVIYGGTVLGYIRSDIASETGISPKCQVVTPATHDTACAVTSVPKLGENIAFLSSGTWSLAGLELDKALITQKTREHNIANSGGAFGKILFLHSLCGLWLIQRARKVWQKKYPDLTYGEIVELAKNAKPFYGYIDTGHDSFLNPKDMTASICEYLKKTNQAQLDKDDIGQVSRIIFESLALKYKHTFENLCELNNRKIDVLNIIGGGIQNKLLTQFASNAMNVKVCAGPIEATSTGNILLQAYGVGELNSLQDIRQVVINTFEPEEYYPQNVEAWQKADEAYKNVVQSL